MTYYRDHTINAGTHTMNDAALRDRNAIFLMFLASGFCGLLYQIVWMRLAFAAFGAITPVLSVVISVFMGGLAIGSWAGGRWIEGRGRGARLPAIGYYGLAELGIGIGGLSVPAIFGAGERILLSCGSMESLPYLAASAGILAISILPWCVGMGATFPFMMAHIRATAPAQQHGFSFLYLANVVGGMLGTLLTAAVLIEWLGLRHCLAVAAAGNFGIAALAFGLAVRTRRGAENRIDSVAADDAADATSDRWTPGILFMTGFTSMALEVVWTRLFTPVLYTTIYAFASLLAVYLCTTWIGSLLYRRHLTGGRAARPATLLGGLAATVLLPLFANDPRLVIRLAALARGFHLPVAATVHVASVALVLASIAPFCLLLGYLLPRLIDVFSGGAPRAAGRAYAINIVGCILGPLVAAYGLLPWLGVKFAFLLLASPYVFFAFAASGDAGAPRRSGRPLAVAAAALVVLSGLFSRTDEDGMFYGPCEIRRDYAATTTAFGTGFQKQLLINGYGMTVLTPVTKFMAHFPLALLDRPRPAVLAICFGMGNTYRSALTWDDTDVTAVELVPGVRDVFGFYFADAGDYLPHPRGRVEIDDGRRFLRRSARRYDLVTIDPPPPMESAGSSLLYSREFLRIIRAHLTDGGILQHWFPGGEKETAQAVAQSLAREFPYVRVFRSVEGWGLHFTASARPIPAPTAAALAAAMPENARRNLLEWNPGCSAEEYFGRLLANEIPIADLLPADPRVEITDDRPYNEYFLVRRGLSRLGGRYAVVFNQEPAR